MTTPNKQDSNSTGLSFAEEASIKTLPEAAVWYGLDPNSYKDFGGQISTVARNPLSAGRQRQKGVTTDLEASGGFEQDLTQTNLTRLLQGFFFADIREKLTNIAMNSAAIAFSSVAASSKTYTLASGTLGSSLAAGDLVFMSGFAQAANNGLKVVASTTATTIVVAETCVDETPAATAKFQKVGTQLASGTADVVVSGSYPRLTRASGSFDFTTLGLIAGEWIRIGGDATATHFVTAANNGFARIRAVAATYLEFDKTDATMLAETGTGLTIRVFIGNVLKNESVANLIKRRTYQLERTLGDDGDGTQSEYLVGAVPNEFNLNIKQADKVLADFSFVGTDIEQRTGATGVKAGTRVAAGSEDAFNTSSDFSRIKMHTIQAGVTAPTALFAYLTDLSLTINNNVSPIKAVGVLGAFDVTAGTFAVSGKVTAYFSDVAAQAAIRNNSDVTIDFALVKRNAGIIFDIPLLSLGDGRLSIERDQPITLPLSMEAAKGTAGHTLLMNEFPYLPSAADL